MAFLGVSIIHGVEYIQPVPHDISTHVDNNVRVTKHYTATMTLSIRLYLLGHTGFYSYCMV